MKVVVKLGTSTLAHSTGHLNIRRVELLCKVLSDLHNAGHQILLVSSGAIGMGMGKLNLSSRPTDMQTKQACAAVGQCELMYTYDKLFGEYNITTAQVLLTGADIEHSGRFVNVQNTLNRLIDLSCIPIINENDTVGTEEIEIGDNDTLSAIVSCLVQADLLILLSDIDGLYDKDPHVFEDAVLIDEIHGVTQQVMEMAGGSSTKLGTGGMTTKLNAAKIANGEGIDMVIVNGDDPCSIYDILDGKKVGTRFCHK